jgi:hypothetical protein
MVSANSANDKNIINENIKYFFMYKRIYDAGLHHEGDAGH